MRALILVHKEGVRQGRFDSSKVVFHKNKEGQFRPMLVDFSAASEHVCGFKGDRVRPYAHIPPTRREEVECGEIVVACNEAALWDQSKQCSLPSATRCADYITCVTDYIDYYDQLVPMEGIADAKEIVEKYGIPQNQPLEVTERKAITAVNYEIINMIYRIELQCAKDEAAEAMWKNMD